MEFHVASTDVLVALVRSSSFMLIVPCWREVLFPDCFAEGRAVSIPKTTDTDDLGRIIRSPDALRPLTLCNCDCKLLTSAVCRGLHWYTIRCVHPSQRCISSWQMICCCISRSRALDCPTFSSASYEAFTGTALHTWNLRAQNEDNSRSSEEYDKVVLRVAFFFCNGF